MFPYHNRLRQLLSSQPYIVIKDKPPFAYRFIFPDIGKSMPIRDYRVAEYQQYIGGGLI